MRASWSCFFFIIIFIPLVSILTIFHTYASGRARCCAGVTTILFFKYNNFRTLITHTHTIIIFIIRFLRAPNVVNEICIFFSPLTRGPSAPSWWPSLSDQSTIGPVLTESVVYVYTIHHRPDDFRYYNDYLSCIVPIAPLS